MKKRVLTGIKPSGTPHIGNYFSAIKPSLKNQDNESFFFIADYHALTTIKDNKKLNQYTLSVASTWLALGLCPEKVFFYKQSDIPELFEAFWILLTLTSKGLLNRSHAYKALVSNNKLEKRPDDEGVNMGLFNYPVLMAIDILLFSGKEIPVGEDQKQHIEIARDLAEKFNQEYGTIFELPEAKIITQKDIPGIDGRKMSKSYNNIIPIFGDPQMIKKSIMQFKTDSKAIDEKKDADNCNLFYLYSLFFDDEKLLHKEKENYSNGGVGYGDLKKKLNLLIQQHFKKESERYNHYISNPKIVHEILREGARKVRPFAKEKLKNIKKAIGIFE